MTLDLPCFLYGPERTLPAVRRTRSASWSPTSGPVRPIRRPVRSPSALGRCWWPTTCGSLDADLGIARDLARRLRSPHVRALAFPLGDHIQVSLNLIAPDEFGPAEAYDAVAAECAVDRAELVGLIPASVLRSVPAHRWTELDLAADRTIEARLESRRLGAQA